MSVLVCENISKKNNKIDIVKNFSYNFLENNIYAILGKADSGQKDILDLISGKTKNTEGVVYLDGIDIDKQTKVNEKICYIANNTLFPHYITIIAILKLMAKFYPNWDTYYAYELLKHYQIDLKSRFGNLNEQEKNILIGILNLSSRAPITIMDNPMENVDLKARYDFFNFLYQHQSKYPRTFILTTSFVDEIDYLVDYLLMIDNGKLIANFSIQEIKDNFSYLTGKTEVLKSLITGVKIIGVEERGKTLTICIRQKLRKDEIRKYQKYLIKISEVPIQKVFIYLINLREIKGIG
ncbi:MAG: ATP-binding cassette domain-containing protein [Bacilli bacterium]